MSKRFAVVVAVLVVASLIASCQPAEQLAKELNVNLGTEPPSLDPSLATDNVSINVDEQLFLGLTDFEDTIDAPVIPELATDWSVSEDGLV